MLATFLVLLILIEFSFRFFFPQQLIILDSSQVWQPEDTIGWSVRPNVSTEINTGERTISFYRDENGFRITRQNPPKADRCNRRILYIGDSYLQAIQVDAEETIPQFIHDQLKNNGVESCYDNAGVLGYDPSQYLINVTKLMTKGNYDLVVVNWFLENDCVDSTYDYLPPIPSENLTDVNFSHFFDWSAFGVNVLRPMNEWSERRFHSYVFFKARFKRLFAWFSDDVKYVPDQFLLNDPSPDRWESTAQIMRKIQILCGSYDTPVLFFLIPARYQTKIGLWQAQIRQDGLSPNEVDRLLPNKKIATFKGMNILDLTPYFEQSEEVLYGSVDHHFSPVGHEEAARILYPHILSALNRSKD